MISLIAAVCLPLLSQDTASVQARPHRPVPIVKPVFRPQPRKLTPVVIEA